jgi:copper(I)-binding protein
MGVELICLARRVTWVMLGVIGLLGSGYAGAHGTRAGDLLIDHPYATPSQPGASTGLVYFRSIGNRGQQSDRLLSGSTARAEQVVLQRRTGESATAPAQTLDAIDLPARSTVELRHTGAYQLVLNGLKQPLKDGDRFDLTLVFERAGRQTVKVWVQTPRSSPGSHAH